ncbi:MAG: hypothetical protein QOI11_3094, partial [Candidatus Eremiobacteraeota bacterium]|nr:hypothetical protein [Candidatus Eremiobacteraeota bacterium]
LNHVVQYITRSRRKCKRHDWNQELGGVTWDDASAPGRYGNRVQDGAAQSSVGVRRRMARVADGVYVGDWQDSFNVTRAVLPNPLIKIAA